MHAFSCAACWLDIALACVDACWLAALAAYAVDVWQVFESRHVVRVGVVYVSSQTTSHQCRSKTTSDWCLLCLVLLANEFDVVCLACSYIYLSLTKQIKAKVALDLAKLAESVAL